MSAEHDRQFFDTFMIVLGALVAFTIAVYLLAHAIAGQTQEKYIDENPLKAKMVAERIAPVASVAISGQPEPKAKAIGAPMANATMSTPAPVVAAAPIVAAAPAPAPGATAAPAAAAEFDGEAVYKSACIACHMTGVAGAPKFADATAWAPRIAKGKDTLYSNSINGFQGEVGVMPPKGGRMDLDDGAIKAAVDYMVNAAQ